ncbi:unnamed protein product [Moneuplotes crassus]|uniref:Zinc finger Mcm10/DnaG-type domain-containing protein n=1 Tax=Euplotes crassus TaxID=5936 RepID=A0AAD1UCL4_EUPCR|nr:unnamed protein product [Moneuplotes crassus]
MQKENVQANADFAMRNPAKANTSKEKELVEETIETYKPFCIADQAEIDDTKGAEAQAPNVPTELEENSKLSIYSTSKVHSFRSVIEKTRHLKYLPSQDIEKYIFSRGPENLEKSHFITGVVVEKKVLGYSEKPFLKYPKKKKTTAYARFKLSDLKVYKSALFSKVKDLKKKRLDDYMRADMSEDDFVKTQAYKAIKFTQDRYKTNEFILFNKTAELFSKNVKYGDLIAILKPSLMDQRQNEGIVLSAKYSDQILVLGKCSNYGICQHYDCAQFMNTEKQKKCLLHKEEDNDMVYKKIKASRANLRSNFVDSQKIMSMRKHEKQMLQSSGIGFKKGSLEMNEYMLTTETKKKLIQKKRDEKAKLKNYVEKRLKKDTPYSILGKVKCSEKTYMKNTTGSEVEKCSVDPDFISNQMKKLESDKKPKIMELDSDGEIVN